MNTDFSFNGINSIDMGVSIVTLESGLVEENFMSEREINMEQITGNPIPYVYGIEYKPFKLSFLLCKLGWGDESVWSLQDRKNIASWLACNKFAEFYYADNPNKVYFLTYAGGIPFTSNGAYQGYIKVEFQSMSPFAYSSLKTNVWHNDVTTPVNFTFTNDGQTLLLPSEMWITKIGDGDVSIVNITNGGKEFKFTGLKDGEVVFINNKKRQITTSLSETSRYDNFNGNYLELVSGDNQLTITGKCDLKLQYRNEYITLI